ncbi:MAG: hypothetical protein DMF53_00030 [Acidobacteria bacterium]|nr:MAG: hypothetical protein DMF53_00030 [Acidobacteriota bacterium]
MDEIKLSEGARAGLLALDAGAYLPGDFEELRRLKLLEHKTLPPANREVELKLTERGRREAERLRAEQQSGNGG